jgi:hypothetical protein
MDSGFFVQCRRIWLSKGLIKGEKIKGRQLFAGDGAQLPPQFEASCSKV